MSWVGRGARNPRSVRPSLHGTQVLPSCMFSYANGWLNFTRYSDLPLWGQLSEQLAYLSQSRELNYEEELMSKM